MNSTGSDVSRVVVTLAALAVLGALGCSNQQDSSGGSGDTSCPAGQRLVDGRCQSAGRDVGRVDTAGTDAGGTEEDPVEEAGACQPDTQSCADDHTVLACDVNGQPQLQDCGDGNTCNDGSCVPGGFQCTPDANLGCNDTASYRVCDQTGQGYTVVSCPAETPNCLVDQCTNQVCAPGQARCAEGDTAATETCNDDGTAWVPGETCGAGLTCDGGACLSPCEENSKVSSFLGCDYWALDLDNIEETCTSSLDCPDPAQTCTSNNVCEPSAASQQFSISISNPADTEVHVSIQNMSDNSVINQTVPAGTAQAIPLPRLDVNGTGKTRNSYHITTDLPVTAHQFNPANNVGVFSNDASLLLPSNSAGYEYIDLGWPTGPFGGPGGHAYAYATIVAVDADGPTTVTVTPSVKVRAGGGVNAMNPGAQTNVTLNQGDVLNLETDSVDGADLSGTIIQADRPVVVFSGHECAFVPDEGPTPYCDHLEQQLFPVETWGDHYFGAKLAPRGTESDVWRVVASVDGTSITTNPAISGINGMTLNRGQMQEFVTNQSFELTASAPVLLGQFMTGSNYPGIPFTCDAPVPDDFCTNSALYCSPRTCSEHGDNCAVECTSDSQCNSFFGPPGNLRCYNGYCAGTGIGDPAFMLAVPLNQYRDNYIFLTPADYQQDWFTVLAPIGTELTFDGQPLLASALVPIADTGFGTYSQSTANPPGGPDPAVAHTITGSQPFSLDVYGYDCDVSYAYPGGLNLETNE